MRFSSIFITLLSFCAFGQINHVTFGHNHKIRINSNGSLAINLADLSPESYEGTNPNLSYLAQAGLWITATDQSDQKHNAVHYLSGIDSFDFWPGPIDTLTGQTGDVTKWNKIWVVTNAQIEDHKSNFDDAQYTMPDIIQNWPANGDGDFSKYLAPFVDFNGNKTYDPENGDYPAIKGDQSAYLVFNDLTNEHTASLGLDIGIEVQLLAYTLPNSDAIILEYYIIGRKSVNYKDIKVGFFIDGECGNRDVNYAGTLQTTPQAIFVYHGDSIDEGFFEADLAHASVIFLENNLSSSIAFGGLDEKSGNPENASDFSNLSNGFWKDGTPLTFGEDGKLSGNKVPYIFAQNKNNSPIWSEEFSPNIAGERSILGVLPSVQFQKNDYVKLRVALSVGNAKVDKLKDQIYDNANSVRNQYLATAGFKNDISLENIIVYPNPATNSFLIKNISNNFSIQLIDNKGIVMPLEYTITNNDLECNINVASGIYYIQLITNYRIITKKLCIHH